MSSQKPPASLRGLSYGAGLTLGGAIVILQSVLFPTDRAALWISCGIGGVCVLVGGWNLWKWWRGHSESLPMSLPEEVHLLPPDQQIAYLERVLKMSLIAFPILTAYITFQLTQLERGNTDSVMLWAPISLLYQAIGYWPTVCATPALGIFCFFALNRRLKQLNSQGNRSSVDDANWRGR